MTQNLSIVGIDIAKSVFHLVDGRVVCSNSADNSLVPKTG